jgi:hypothetical protein
VASPRPLTGYAQPSLRIACLLRLLVRVPVLARILIRYAQPSLRIACLLRLLVRVPVLARILIRYAQPSLRIASPPFASTVVSRARV